uniref:Ninein n=1 Tax=Oncorhynchus mykiss TaxID=8022 RepID=A0A8C7Q6B5_ONCMY
MDDGQQDQYEERLKEVFESFDASGAGSLCPEELSDLCQALHLEDSTPTLLHALLQNQDPLTGRVGFDQFKNALILVLSTSIVETPAPSQQTAPFVRGSKRYGRHSTPEFIDTVTDFSEVLSSNATDPEDHEDSTVPRKRERWNAHESGTEEYEAEGQLHLWNPDEPSTPRGSITPLSDHQEERFREACEELAMPWDGCTLGNVSDCLFIFCLQVTEDVLQVLSGDEVMSVQAFTSWVLNHAKPPTPSASTPYRQLKRLHSSQPFDETGRRTSAMTSTIGMRLFSTLDDGTGSAPAEDILDAWMEEGIENSPEILQALDFDLEGKVNLRELTVALENELLVTKNGIHQAALASFKAEIRYLLERVDRELREKEKTRSDLDKAEKLKTQLASEVDEHHSAIEHMNDLNLRKLEQEHREKLVSVRSELIKEMDQIQQQTGQQREKLEAEMEKLRDDETFLRDHLSLTVKESRRLEMELLDSTEKLVEAENQVSKLQRNLDNILKEKFGDLDLGSAEFFLQEESLRRLRSSYEEQCRELQDRIDELQAELQEYHNLGRTSQLCLKPSLSEDLESKSPGMESDPGLGSEEGQPLFNMSLEAEMMLERLKEKHLREMEELQAQLESKVTDSYLAVFQPHFSQKIREVEARFSGDQDAVAERFQTDVSNLEKHYQSKLKALTDNHAEQKTKWDAETEEALQKAEEQRRVLQETREQERETITQDLVKERELLESVHKEEMGALVVKNHELQKELESFISLAQTKEIELSRQLNDLHNRLQENLDTKDELLAKSEKKAQEIELLLNQAVEDFKQERAELQGNLSELEVRHSLAEKQLEEMSELLSEHDNQKLKIKELENLLRQAAVDFQFERLELQENISDLELKLKESRPSSDPQDNEKGELLVERDQLSIRIREIENELNQLLDSADMTGGKDMGESNEVNVAPLGEEHIEAAALEEQVGSENITVSDETCDNVVPEDCEGLDVEYVFPMAQGPNDKVEIITVSPHEMEISENIIAEVCDQEITVTSDNLNVLVEASETCGEQGQDDEVEMIPETPNRLEECPEDTITLHFDGTCDDETSVDDGQDAVVESVAVEEQAQDDNASEGRMNAETSEDIEVCPENIISVEACNGEVAAIPEECQDLVEESQSSECQCQAEDNMDEDTNDDIVAMSIPEEKPQSDDIDGDVCPSEIKCKDSSPDKIGQNDASVQETVFDDKPEEEELQDDLINEEVKSYVSLVVSSALEEIGHDTDDTKVACLFEETQDLEKKPVELIPQLQQRCEEAVNERDDYIREILELHEQVSQLESEASLLAQLQSQYDTATEENLALQQKISELQQKSDALESLSAENDQQPLEENDTFKAQVNKIKVTSSDMTSLQIRYEECICENAKLEEQNCRLEKRVVGLESKMHIIQDFQDQQVALVDEITRMREENCKLTELVSELERQDEILMALQLEAESEEDATTEQEQESFLDLNSQLEAKIQVVSELEDCCTEFEKQNAKLRRYVFLGGGNNTGASKEKVCKSINDQSILLLFQTHVLDESLQSVNLQNARLKSDLRVSQQEKDALKQEVMSLHKQLQNANDKNQVLEMALHSSGYQSQHKKLYRDELARLVEQEQQLLRQENERLTVELHNTKDDLHHSRDKTRQLEAAILTVKQQKQQGQSSVVKTVEQEKTALKRELNVMHQELLCAQNKVIYTGGSVIIFMYTVMIS